jgi:hypothetical protein
MIVCIGLCKDGTSSIIKAFKSLGKTIWKILRRAPTPLWTSRSPVPIDGRCQSFFGTLPSASCGAFAHLR